VSLRTLQRHVQHGLTIARIYAELADQYKVLDAASAVAKRRVLAEHLKEVIDTLERKVSLSGVAGDTSLHST
jgi:hypothetical protein